VTILRGGSAPRFSGRVRDARRGLTIALPVGLVLVALAALGLESLLRALIGTPFAVRVALTVALLAPLGVCFGTAMPVGMRRFVAEHPDGAPYAWGVNGVTSVLASVLGVFIAIHFGFRVATSVAGACYLVALGHVGLGRWPQASATAPRQRDSADVL
jgi:hypothetical protein